MWAVLALDVSNSNYHTRHLSNSTANSWSALVPMRILRRFGIMKLFTLLWESFNPWMQGRLLWRRICLSLLLSRFQRPRHQFTLSKRKLILFNLWLSLNAANGAIGPFPVCCQKMSTASRDKNQRKILIIYGLLTPGVLSYLTLMELQNLYERMVYGMEIHAK